MTRGEYTADPRKPEVRTLQKDREELVDALNSLIKEIDEWNNAVQEIIGRVPNYHWKELEDARELSRQMEKKL